MGLDSVEYIMHLEEKFQITVTDEEASLLYMVGEAEIFLRRKRSDLSPDDIHALHMKVIAKILMLEPDALAAIKPTDRFIEDLNFD